MKQYDDFDDVLSEALSEFREAEPRAGLAGRLKAGVGAAEHAPRFAWWKWAAVAAAAVLMIAFWIARPKAPVPVAHKEEAPAHTAPVQKVEKKQEVAVVPKVERRSVAKVHRAVERVKSEQAVAVQAAGRNVPFPVPRQLSPEEKALVQLARNQPVVLVQTQQAQEQFEKKVPIEIQGLQVEPIDGGER